MRTDLHSETPKNFGQCTASSKAQEAFQASSDGTQAQTRRTELQKHAQALTLTKAAQSFYYSITLQVRHHPGATGKSEPLHDQQILGMAPKSDAPEPIGLRAPRGKVLPWLQLQVAVQQEPCDKGLRSKWPFTIIKSELPCSEIYKSPGRVTMFGNLLGVQKLTSSSLRAPRDCDPLRAWIR